MSGCRIPYILIAVLIFGGAIGSVIAEERAPGAAKSNERNQTDPASGRLFTLHAATDDLVLVDWSRDAVRELAATPGRRRVSDLPLHAGLTVDLDIEPFSVIGPTFRLVLGRRGRPDLPIDFDPSSVSLFRGEVFGHPGSDVFFALSETLSTGYVDLGTGRKRYRIASSLSSSGSPSSSSSHTGASLSSGRLAIFEAGSPPALPPDVPFCGVEHEDTGGRELTGSGDFGVIGGGGSAPESTGPIKGLKHLELAVETDYEFFTLFGDLTEAMTYLTAMYGEVSNVYARDVDTRVELVFTRLWDDPNDLFNDVDPTPLPDFQDYWNANMGAVQRDVAQLLSGRRDYPFGGQASLSALCDTRSYSVVGYAMGFFPDPSKPSPYNYDISVTAHELGHNCGTGHTHDSPNFIDTCFDPGTTPQRGTIMSYCGQTWSGGNANRDLYFHSTIQSNMDLYINFVSCVVLDCNQNGVDDATDISQSTSLDVNTNNIPDECEDCNTNSVLDDTDISMGTSFDVNSNGVPDECEPDCNGNNVPDEKDIADATSTDAYGNDIPDECEADCDADGTSDYTQIQADMTLDVDRSAVLDSCQDCDSDGTSDLDALAGVHSTWVASGLASSPVRRHYASTGVLTANSGGSGAALADEGFDLVIAPSGHLLVTSNVDHRVMEFDASGSYLGDLVATGAGGLASPTGLIVTPDKLTLLVSSAGTNSVLAYDVVTGSSGGAFITPGSGGLSGPFGLIFGPNGNLFVTSDTNEVLEYNGQTGAFLSVFVGAAANGGLDQPRGIAFKPDGNLLVASFGTDEVLEYEGQTGAPLGKWAQVGTATVLTQVSPWGVRVGPNGNVFVGRTGHDYGSGSGGAHSHEQDDHAGHDDQAEQDDHADQAVHADQDDHADQDVHAGQAVQAEHDNHAALHLSNAQIYEFDARNGNFLRTYVGGNDHGLLFPTGFDFVPGWDIDCNLSLLPDSCDIALGFSLDLDTDGTPDECQIDCNSNGTLDRLDIIPYGPGLDCNNNLIPDTCDLTAGTSLDCTGNGIPDECETDCNANGIADSCDLDAGSSADCNLNGIPDECDVTDDFEIDLGWTAGAPGDTATTGVWTRVDPIGTDAQAEDDHTPGVGTICFVTGQGTVGGAVGENDVDGGTTTLISPTYDLSSDSEAEISYWRWYSREGGGNPNQDALVVDVSDDGGNNWTTVETVSPTGPEASGGWFFHKFRVADFVTPNNNIVLRFVAEDAGSDSIVEAALDDLSIITTCCVPPAETEGLTLVEAAMTQLAWTDQGVGIVYDVVSGDMTTLLSAGNTSDATCQADDHTLITWDDSRPDPSSNTGYYYLVRAEECAAGTYGNATGGAERQPVSDCP